MTNKVFSIIFAVFAVLLYTMAVISFTEGHVADGISILLFAASDTLMAYALLRNEWQHQALVRITAIPFKKFKATDNGDDEIPEEELTEDEKRIKRMAEEYEELAGRYERLTSFLASDKFKTLSEKSGNLLVQQYKAMCEYMEALKQRIQLECDTANKE